MRLCLEDVSENDKTHSSKEVLGVFLADAGGARNILQALFSVLGDLPQGGRAHTSVLLPPPVWPEQDAPGRAGDVAKRVACEKKPSALGVLPQITSQTQT